MYILKVNKTLTRTDIDNIAKLAVNIYHGKSIYINGNKNDNPVDICKWSVDQIDYEYIPTRCIIYINTDDDKSLCSYKIPLYRAFKKYVVNYRESEFYYHEYGTNIFTLEERSKDQITFSIDLHKNVFDGNPYHVKYAKYPFSIILCNMCRIKKPIFDTLKMHEHIMSRSTIITDTEDKFQESEYDDLLSNDYKICKNKIYINTHVGIDMHLYINMSKKYINTYDVYMIKKEIHKYKSNTTYENCSECSTLLFGKYYIVKNGDVEKSICKFCAHYNRDIAIYVNTCDVYIAKSNYSNVDIINTIITDELEKDILLSLIKDFDTYLKFSNEFIVTGKYIGVRSTCADSFIEFQKKPIALFQYIHN